MRPSLTLWLRYAYVGSLPPQYHEWVLHDVTGRTWLLRHMARFLLYLAPLIVLMLVFLPMSIGFRFGLVMVGLLGSAALSFGYIVDGAEKRAEKAGYEYGIAQRIRDDRAQRRQRETAARLRARRQERWDRRGR